MQVDSACHELGGVLVMIEPERRTHARTCPKLSPHLTTLAEPCRENALLHGDQASGPELSPLTASPDIVVAFPFSLLPGGGWP